MADTPIAAARVRPIGAADLARLLAWRNHPEVRRHMFDSHEIAPDEHARWFERAIADPSRHLLVFEAAGVPAGFVHFTRGRHPHVADWGFYAAPDAPRGSGRALGHAALDHAFGPLALHKVCGQALETNPRSVALHQALGFRQEGLLREQHFDGERFVALLQFGMLAHEWNAAPGDLSP